MWWCRGRRRYLEDVKEDTAAAAEWGDTGAQNFSVVVVAADCPPDWWYWWISLNWKRYSVRVMPDGVTQIELQQVADAVAKQVAQISSSPYQQQQQCCDNWRLMSADQLTVNCYCVSTFVRQSGVDQEKKRIRRKGDGKQSGVYDRRVREEAPVRRWSNKTFHVVSTLLWTNSSGGRDEIGDGRDAIDGGDHSVATRFGGLLIVEVERTTRSTFTSFHCVEINYGLIGARQWVQWMTMRLLPVKERQREWQEQK